MGDRFYAQQIAAGGGTKKGEVKKPPRRLKADIVSEVENTIGKKLPSLSKMTITDLTELETFLNEI